MTAPLAPVSPRARNATALPGPAFSRGRRAWLWLSGAFAALLGLAPHVLHHAGPFAGAALVGGFGGSLLFGAIGFLLAVPFLLRLRRQHGGWRVPLAILGVMVAVFSLSTFVVGPAINGDDEATIQTPTDGSGSGHLGHH